MAQYPIDPAALADLTDFTVRAGTPNRFQIEDVGGVKEIVLDPGANEKTFASYDPAGQPTDFEIVAQVCRDSSSSLRQAGVMGRFVNDVNGVDGYGLQRVSSTDVTLRSFVDGGNNEIRRELGVMPNDAVTFAWMRLRVNADQVKFKVWQGTAAEEPVAWTYETTNATVTAAGYVGPMAYSSIAGGRFRWVGIGTVGDSAPLPQSDTTAPTVTAPTVSNIGQTSASVGATSDESGTGYGVVLPAGASAPNGSQVKAGTDGLGNPAAASGSVSCTAGSPFTVGMSGLTAGTAYDYYVTAEDAAGNLQATPVSGAFTTTSTALSSTTRVENKSGTALASETNIKAWFYEDLQAAPTDTWTGEETDVNGDLVLTYTNATGVAGTLVVELSNGHKAVATVTPA